MTKLTRVLLAAIIIAAFVGVGCDENVCTDNDYTECDNEWLACANGESTDTQCTWAWCEFLEDEGCDWEADEGDNRTCY
jgi:hypothetical protein